MVIHWFCMDGHPKMFWLIIVGSKLRNTVADCDDMIITLESPLTVNKTAAYETIHLYTHIPQLAIAILESTDIFWTKPFLYMVKAPIKPLC